MAFTFPSSPTTGDVYGQYTWNGYAWSITSSGGGGGGGGVLNELDGGSAVSLYSSTLTSLDGGNA